MDQPVKVIDDTKLAEVISFEQSKINSLSIISEQQREVMCQSAKYTAIPYMPITKPFIQQYILNNTEYPLVESKISQAAIEMKSRLNRIIDSNFSYEKECLELKELELDIEELKNGPVVPSSFAAQRNELQISKKELDVKNKKWRIISIKQEIDSSYKEFLNWYETINELVAYIQEKDPSVGSFKDINYDAIRMAEMAIKVQRWQKMEQAGMELTPSQKVFTYNEDLNKEQAPKSDVKFFDFKQ